MKPAPLFLVAIDFSPGAAAALELALELGRPLGAAYLLLHVIPFDDSDAALPLPGPNAGLETVDGRAADAHAALQRLAASLETSRPPGAIRVQVLRGRPVNEICRCATLEGAELLVLATRRRRGLAHLLLGNTAEAVVRSAPCPVLTVPPPGENEKTS